MTPFCYYLPEGTMGVPKGSTVKLAIVKANQDGWFPTDYEFSVDEAQSACDVLNRRLGLSQEQVDAIVASSMFGVKYPEKY